MRLVWKAPLTARGVHFIAPLLVARTYKQDKARNDPKASLSLPRAHRIVSDTAACRLKANSKGSYTKLDWESC